MSKSQRSELLASTQARLRSQGFLIGATSRQAIARGCATSLWQNEKGETFELIGAYSSEALARSQEPWSDVQFVQVV